MDKQRKHKTPPPKGTASQDEAPMRRAGAVLGFLRSQAAKPTKLN